MKRENFIDIYFPNRAKVSRISKSTLKAPSSSPPHLSFNLQQEPLKTNSATPALIYHGYSSSHAAIGKIHPPSMPLPTLLYIITPSRRWYAFPSPTPLPPLQSLPTNTLLPNRIRLPLSPPSLRPATTHPPPPQIQPGPPRPPPRPPHGASPTLRRRSLHPQRPPRRRPTANHRRRGAREHGPRPRAPEHAPMAPWRRLRPPRPLPRGDAEVEVSEAGGSGCV